LPAIILLKSDYGGLLPASPFVRILNKNNTLVLTMQVFIKKNTKLSVYRKYQIIAIDLER
jgi:hypothetical protein